MSSTIALWLWSWGGTVGGMMRSLRSQGTSSEPHYHPTSCLPLTIHPSRMPTLPYHSNQPSSQHWWCNRQRELLLFELTISYETMVEEACGRKRAKYQDLLDSGRAHHPGSWVSRHACCFLLWHSPSCLQPFNHRDHYPLSWHHSNDPPWNLSEYGAPGILKVGLLKFWGRFLFDLFDRDCWFESGNYAVVLLMRSIG